MSAPTPTASPNDHDSLRCRPKGEEKMIERGFEPRFVGDRRMLADATKTYEELGYEVATLRLDADSVSDDCSDCALVTGSFAVIYTRRS